MSKKFGPSDAAEEAIFAEERFRVHVQHALQKVMNRNGVTQRELAKRLGVTEARVSQLFSSECNVTIKALARAFHALGEECRLTVQSPSVEWTRTSPTEPVLTVADSGVAQLIHLQPHRISGPAYSAPDVCEEDLPANKIRSA